MEYLISAYTIIEIIVCSLGGLVSVLLITEQDMFEMDIKTIIINSFYPQTGIVNFLDGVVNKYGKAVVIILSAPFLLPLNVILLTVQSVFYFIYAVCLLFVFIFEEKDK